MKYIFSIIILVVIGVCALAQVPAFPGAEGFGKYATGGRGGKVVIVSNLDDDGPGSFRQAFKEFPGEPITIVFSVAGIIDLKSPVKISRPNITIAGQTAPGDGICLKGNSFIINCAGDKSGVRGNIIIRYLRSRPGAKIAKGVYGFGMENSQNIIVDHCSFTWANEECAAMYDTKNVTVQWSIISEGLYNANHHKGLRAYGGVWGGQHASYHHNLISNQNSRTVRFNGSRAHDTLALVDYRNNVIFNWKSANACYGGEVDIEGGRSNINMVNNYYIPGPATPKDLKFVKANYNAEKAKGFGQWFVQGNVMAGNKELTNNNKKGVDLSEFPDAYKDKAIVKKSFAVSEEVAMQTAQEAYQLVLKKVGAALPKYDKVDLRLINEAKTHIAKNGANGIINDASEVGGWPVYNFTTAPIDSDKDGMPDEWEKTHKLDPKNTADGAKYGLDKQYTNLEVYLNSLTTK
ncbi:pectate lyase family protein [Niabella ginsengisoli]|uniref:Pectate lyase n=1 Tax=Niabella ginsengisoli TaxID=522298 RepID=A0ABS9SPC6_9BACT|nr:pectate lyase [Niabella ginsengisoli]MCH5600220.1 pectate lyase [Niabella ginsengisoli]